MIPFLYLLFICSGAAGLFYESVWSRYLSLFVGHGAYAQVIVLVIFLGGMALGAALVSRRSARLSDPLYGYAMIELGIGLVGIVFHDAIYQPVTGWAYDTLFPAIGGGLPVQVVKWGLAGLLILPQSILLGATFPLMSAGVIRRAPERPGTVLALLYFANSLGAAGGVLIAGFYLVRAAGLPGTLLAAAIVNLLVGLAALIVAKLRPPAAVAVQAAPEHPIATFPGDAAVLSPELLRRLLIAAACGTALASFIYEVSWIRLLSLVLGSATHSFELMLSAFILGLALGAFWIRRRMEALTRPLAALAAIQILMGTLAAGSLVLYERSFDWVANLMAAVGRTEQGYALYNLARYGLCLVIMLPATFCAGMTLPLITRTLYVSGAGERAIGSVYAWNTFGSILGATAGSLALIPLLGLKGALLVGAAADMAIGLMLIWPLARREAPVRRTAVLCTILSVVAPAVVAVGVRLDRAMLVGGVFRTGRVPYGESQVVFYRDGRTATVSVMQPPAGRLSIATNGKPDGSLDPRWLQACAPGDSLTSMSGDDPTQVLLAMVTLAHRAGAGRAAVIGHGTGMSSHTLLASPALDEVVTLEIEPVMVEASRAFYPANRRVFDDPRSVHVFDDAKAYFAAANRRFDLIVAEPSNPWVSGVSGLFTTEFYERVKRYIAPGGLLGQWLHTYELSDDLVLTVLGAIHRNFADYRVYSVNSADLLILASPEGPLPAPDWRVFDLPAVRADLCHFYPVVHGDLDALLITTRLALSPLLDHAPQVNSDFYPVLDLGAERARFLGGSASGINSLFRGLHDFAGPAGMPPLVPDNRIATAFRTIPRLGALLNATQLRLGGQRPGADTAWSVSPHADANEGIRRWLEGIRAGQATASWPVWAREFSAAFGAWHAGSRGWTDPAFTQPVEAWLDRHGAPAPVRAAVEFRERMARREYAAAAPAVRMLLVEALVRRFWVEPELLREGAVLSLVATGDPDEARSAFLQLTPHVPGTGQDLRARLLASYVGGAGGGGAPPAAGVP